MNRYAGITESAGRALESPRMHVFCCVCGRWLYDEPCAPAQDGKRSHGICPKGSSCYAKALEER